MLRCPILGEYATYFRSVDFAVQPAALREKSAKYFRFFGMGHISFTGQWDRDEGLHYISTEEFGLPQTSDADDSEATALIRKWHHGLVELDAPEDVPLSDINASIQGAPAAVH